MFTRILVPKVLEPKLRYNVLGLACGTKAKLLLLRSPHASCYSLCRLVSAFVVLIITCSIYLFPQFQRQSSFILGIHRPNWLFSSISVCNFFPQVITLYESTLNYIFISKYIRIFAQWQVNAKSSNIVLLSH